MARRRRKGLRGLLGNRWKSAAIWFGLAMVVMISRLFAGTSIDSINDAAAIYTPIFFLALVIGALVFLVLKLRGPIFSRKSKNQTNIKIDFRESSSTKETLARHKIPRDIKPIIEYWHQSVVDGQQMQISHSDMQQLGVVVSLEEMSRGRVNSETVEIMLRRAEDGAQQIAPRDRNNKFESGDVAEHEVLLIPWRFSKAKQRGLQEDYRGEHVSPILIPARLHIDGTLSPPKRNTPWIPRTLLEPLPEGSSMVLGECEDVEDFFHRTAIPRDQGWGPYWKYCDRLLHHVCGTRIAEFAIDGYKPNAGPTVMLNTETGGANNIERLYEDILDGKQQVGLMAPLARLKKPSERPIDLSVKAVANGAKQHLGQFEHSFALAPSQRVAVQQSIQLENGEILAISGPPGTGKTTVIQSLVATLWVSAASQKSARPPILVVCSSTNKAVTNVIDSFAKASSKEGILSSRWLPDFSSYGTFCASATRAREVQEVADIPIEQINGECTSHTLESQEYLRRAHKHYLNCFAKHAFPTKSVKQAVAHLHGQLQKEVKAIHSEISFALNGNLNESFKRLLRQIPAKQMKEVYPTLQKLDTTRRHTAFQLATHYWEGRWLLECMALNENFPGRKPRRKSRQDWERLAMLTPCFVSTFAMAPRFFGGQQNSEREAIDLLISDESGQVPPEEGAASFSLAKRGVIIGDMHQLQPHWSVPEYIDEGNLQQFGLIKDVHDPKLGSYRLTGVLASSGSLMQRARQACPLVTNNIRGVFLSEHRRCTPELVRYVNLLCYGDRLKPKRPPLKNRILPPFGYAHVRGISSRAGKSRLNKPEAEVIATWLRQNREELEEFYRKPLSEIAAVITPFAAQHRYLKHLLGREFPTMTIGTVNSLQGAECPIVMFSPVYSQTDQVKVRFYDRSPHMLNVAVTRAKDSFLVFGDMGIFNQNEKSPSGLLARFLFLRSSHELVDVEPVPRKRISAESVERITTLGAHREILVSALRHAEKEVTIVSPTISYRAIMADRLEEEISAAIKRGVDVNIFTDRDLDRDIETKEVRLPAALGRQALVKSGANLYITDRIHNKAIAVDRNELTEGSFNWLSAVRKEGGRYQKHEVSKRIRSEKIKSDIQDLRQEALHRVESKESFDQGIYEKLLNELKEKKQAARQVSKV